MKIYLDVLLFLNAVVDYLIISVTERLVKSNTTVLRKILGSVIASTFSLTVFLPTLGVFYQFLLRLFCSLVTCLVAFGYNSIKVFIRHVVYFYLSSFIYVGIMIAVWFLFKPQSLAINNSVVYFNISPLFIIFCTLLSYLSINVFRYITKRNSDYAERCQVIIYLSDKIIQKTAMIDTGHTLSDAFSDSEIIFADKRVFCDLIGKENLEKLEGNTGFNIDEFSNRIRLIPCNSVTGDGLIKGIRCDKAVISLNNKQTIVLSPIIALSQTKFLDDYQLIISSDTVKENVYAI